jgi:hypothetical protein
MGPRKAAISLVSPPPSSRGAIPGAAGDQPAAHLVRAPVTGRGAHARVEHPVAGPDELMQSRSIAVSRSVSVGSVAVIGSAEPADDASQNEAKRQNANRTGD